MNERVQSKRRKPARRYSAATERRRSLARMLPYLAQACREARLDADKHQVHVAATLNVRESTIARFEQGKSWPHNADATVTAYAECTGKDPRSLWARALALWEAEQ